MRKLKLLMFWRALPRSMAIFCVNIVVAYKFILIIFYLPIPGTSQVGLSKTDFQKDTLHIYRCCPNKLLRGNCLLPTNRWDAHEYNKASYNNITYVVGYTRRSEYLSPWMLPFVCLAMLSMSATHRGAKENRYRKLMLSQDRVRHL